MKIVHTLICCFFLFLQDGKISIINAQITTYRGDEGGEFKVECFSSSSENWRIFCKEPCEENIIETTENIYQSGRYNMKYEERYLSDSMTVTITSLSTSDLGRYRCGVRTSSYSDSLMKFSLIVADALLDGNNPGQTTIIKTSGADVTVACSFTFSGSRKLFCKNDCEKQENILIDTNDDSATRDKYSIEYTGGLFELEYLYVTIKQLHESDSGHYRCGLHRNFAPDSYRDFWIEVTDVPSSSTPTTAATTTPSSDSTETFVQNRKTEGLILYVSLALVFVIILLLLAVLIFCRNRSSKRGHRMETEYVSSTEKKRVYEEIQEDKHSPSTPVEISPVYTRVKYNKSKKVTATDDYSVITAADHQHKAADDAELNYSEVIFPNRTNGSAPRGGDHVIYSVPRAEASSDPPLYSTVSSH